MFDGINQLMTWWATRQQKKVLRQHLALLADAMSRTYLDRGIRQEFADEYTRTYEQLQRLENKNV